MDEDKTNKKVAAIICLISVYLFLEGSGIINVSDSKQDAPGWVLVLTGVVFMLTGIMILFRRNKNINNLLASLLTAVMGIAAGWVSLYSDAVNFSGNGILLSRIFDMPFE